MKGLRPTINPAMLNKLHKPLRRLNATPTNHQHGTEVLMPDTPQFATPGTYESLGVHANLAATPGSYDSAIHPGLRAKRVQSFQLPVARGSTVGLNSQMTPTEWVDEAHAP